MSFYLRHLRNLRSFLFLLPYALDSATLRDLNLARVARRFERIMPRWILIAACCLAVTLCATGCATLFDRGPAEFAGTQPGVPVENPIFVPGTNCDFVWSQVIDTLDDYFRTERMEPIRVVDGVLTEGRIETYPAVGSTVFEPWRRDSTPGYEKLHATLQTIRRRAIVQLIPNQGGIAIQVTVIKELEDVDRPENASVGLNTLRYDNALVRNEVRGNKQSGAITLGWIPIGRDTTLEQRILAELRARLFDITTDAPGVIGVPSAQPGPVQ